jgi:hypothetical protein
MAVPFILGFSGYSNNSRCQLKRKILLFLFDSIIEAEFGAGDGIRTRDVLLGRLAREKLTGACCTDRLPPYN